ncbi:Left-right determination factor 2 [Holothuria leucospilota]|uniref:Left-right determination factor 2 n=1 Tax=Holothuria leucospilota TaxID=206669 RepID=A0A9Q1CIA1_HOLLE|nr:Left-right determination factor 2 [Holothuria leucospilota]
MPLDSFTHEDEFQVNFLNKVGIEDPTREPLISKENIVIPADIREKYESMLHHHREKRRVITKGIRKIPGIPGQVLFANATRQMFKFQLEHRVPPDSDIVLAEMKIYQDRANDAVFFNPSNHSHRHHPTSARVSLHQMLDVNGITEAVFADERMVAVNSSGWKIFDITDTIDRWTRDPTPTIDIELTVNPIRQGRHARRIAEKVRFVTEEAPNDAPYGYPVLTVYTVKYMPKLDPEPRQCDQSSSPESQRCCRTSRYIDFRNMRWANRWVIEPSGFEAYDCVGTCSHHRSYRDLLSNLFRSGRTGGAGGTSYRNDYRTCGISRSASLPMMYMTENNGVMELKVEEIPNMIAEECSCQR